MDKQAVTTLTNKLNKRYRKTALGQDVQLTVKRGEVHEYLGMTLDYRTKGKVCINMRQYINQILQELAHLSDRWEATAVTPAAENVFKIYDNAKSLSTIETEQFHHIVAQLHFLCRWGRPDI